MSATSAHPVDVAEPATTPADVPSFDEVYDAHVDFLWRSARALGVPATAIDDVLQDVFVVVHRRLPEFEGRAAIRTWLARILVRVIQEHRRRFRRKHDHAALPDDVVDVTSAGPHEEVARAEAVRLLGEILAAMGEDQRTVFVLAEIEQMPVPEIASALEVNVNTVYSRLRLARREYDRHLARLRAKDEWRQP
ncbi:RNA polymerase sigma factor [Sandaracinus amylolyticus]|uniref:RNA polymerase sigma factor RpoE n=1 Tax=Sandaracinus amylolyticus TaxID=927083 RepID=A0A0F6SES0_9BACT|nr:sigma-70 family RNA polymerase sigma factor [Sandaracinus amylolyticus]AKF05679.1 RNA polymerase sigma factor RpoE [Sandaracinus amylolyticus]